MAFFDFGYYRIFKAFLYKYPEKFLTDKEINEVLDDKRKEFGAYMMSEVL